MMLEIEAAGAASCFLWLQLRSAFLSPLTLSHWKLTGLCEGVASVCSRMVAGTSGWGLQAAQCHAGGSSPCEGVSEGCFGVGGKKKAKAALLSTGSGSL